MICLPEESARWAIFVKVIRGRLARNETGLLLDECLRTYPQFLIEVEAQIVEIIKEKVTLLYYLRYGSSVIK